MGFCYLSTSVSWVQKKREPNHCVKTLGQPRDVRDRPLLGSLRRAGFLCDLTGPGPPKGSWGNSLISLKSRLNIIIWPVSKDVMMCWWGGDGWCLPQCFLYIHFGWIFSVLSRENSGGFSQSCARIISVKLEVEVGELFRLCIGFGFCWWWSVMFGSLGF